MPKLRFLDPQVRGLEPAVRDVRIENTIHGDLVRPERLPRPNCQVWLICGPPAAGKSTYVRNHAKPGDIVVDLDAIASEYGLGREYPWDTAAMLLQDRNQRLAALAKETSNRVAWVITTGGTGELRRWWCNVLGVEPDHLIVLVPPREELYRRIMADPERRSVRNIHMRVVDKWLMDNG